MIWQVQLINTLPTSIYVKILQKVTFLKQKFNYIAIYKPYRVLTQFSSCPGKLTLADIFSFPKDVYPVGRLDYDSEGLLILTNDNYLKSKLINPKEGHKKTYFVQVEGVPTKSDLEKLKNGFEINIKGAFYKVKAVEAILIDEPKLPNRYPPIRFRRNIPTSWLSITVTEGKYHQIRKMTAKVGYPTLRLIRYAIENLTLDLIEIDRPTYFSKRKIYTLLNL